MTRVTYFGLTSNSFASFNGGELVFSSLVGSSNTTYIFTNTDGNRVTMIGNDIVVNGSGRFVSGTINTITISPDGGSATDVDVRIGGLGGLDGTKVLGSAGVNVPSPDAAWQAVLEGDVDLVSQGDGVIEFGLDGVGLFGNQSVLGDDNTATGDFGDGSTISGSFLYAFDNVVINSGQFTFSGQASFVYGDVAIVFSNSLVRGGDDSLTFDRGTAFPNLYADSQIIFSGDSRHVVQSALLVGGDDVIDMRDATTTGRVLTHGDALAAFDSATVNGGNDVIFGARKSFNEMYGDVGNLGAGATGIGGNDTLYGGNRGDLIYGDFDGSGTNQTGGNDTLYGGNGNDQMFGGGGDDRLFNAFGRSDIFGGDGNDRFTPMADGNHVFVGGDGRDYIDYGESSTKVIINLGTQTAIGGWADNDFFTSVENARGSTVGDTLIGSSGQNILFGDSGNDLMFGRGGSDSLYAGQGSDQFLGENSKDYYFGGKGFDTLDYGNSDARIRINLDNGVFKGGYAEGDQVKGVENVFGSRFDDEMRGDDGANFLRGMRGADLIFGKKGGDRLAGHQGQDVLFGGKGGDLVFGGAGADDIFGGTGNDFLRGGGGKDVFVFKRGDDYDRIVDFQANRDQLRLENISDKQFENGIQQIGDDVYINFGGGDQLYIDDITVNQLRNSLYEVTMIF